jgi:DNA-binding winged helix-turn-helix (wHTH) protein/Tol biopolymer transport system component
MRAETGARQRDGEIIAFRSGPFELSLRSGELRKSGVLVRIQHQPFKVLSMLVACGGELVTREEIQREVWPDGTFVDFEQSLNFCVRQIRSVLGDSALVPRYVETLPRRGYRWIAPVEALRAPASVARPTFLQVPSSQEALEDRESPTPEGEPRTPSAPATRRGLFVLLGVVTLILVSTAAYFSRPTQRVPLFHRLTFQRGFVTSARFAPDGQVVFNAAWDGLPPAFYLASAANPESRRLEETGYRVVGTTSSGEMAFLKDTTLALVPLAGGPPREVLDGVIDADSTPDGASFAIVRKANDAFRIEFPVGNVLGQAFHPSHLRISPKGDRVAFLEHPIPGDDRGSAVVLDRSGKKTVVSRDWASIEGLAWSPRGNEVWFTAARVGADSALYAVDLSGRERSILSSMGRLVIHDIAPDGRMLLERTAMRGEIHFGHPGAKDERDLSWFDLSTVDDLSADGRLMLFGESGEGGGPEYGVFLRSTDGSLPMRIGHGRPMGLSPDGKWVLAIPVIRPDHIDLLPTGAGEVRAIKDPGIIEYQSAGWLPDGKGIVLTARSSDGNARGYVRDLEGGTPRPITPPGVLTLARTVSPDGKYVVGSCGDKFCLYPLSRGEPRVLPSVEGPQPLNGLPKGCLPLTWGESGRILWARGDEGKGTTIQRVNVNTGRSEIWRDLKPPDAAGVRGLGGFVVSRDGTAYAYSFFRILSDLYVVEGI